MQGDPGPGIPSISQITGVRRYLATGCPRGDHSVVCVRRAYPRFRRVGDGGGIAVALPDAWAQEGRHARLAEDATQPTNLWERAVQDTVGGAALHRCRRQKAARRQWPCQAPSQRVTRTNGAEGCYKQVDPDVTNTAKNIERSMAMPTDCLFREDSYLKDCSATVVGLTEAGGIVLDRTVFYAASGGQPADRGVLTTATGDAIAIANVGYTDSAKSEIAHLPAVTTGPQLKIGEPVQAAIDWNLRYARMRMHTALHLLSAALPYPVTGGAVGDSEGRLDFDIPEAGLDKDEITRKLAEMIGAGAEVRARWITDEELEAQPGLVKTMSVKPPVGTGRVRLIEIVGYDLQPCGGTHVRTTNEIGDVRVTQIEKKGRQNRRVRIAFA